VGAVIYLAAGVGVIFQQLTFKFADVLRCLQES